MTTSDCSASGSWSTTISVAGRSGGRSPSSIWRLSSSTRSFPTPSKVTTLASAIPNTSWSRSGQPYRPRPHEKRSEARSGGPAELGRRKAGRALVADAEGVDLRALRLRHVQLRPRGMEHPGEPDRLAVFDPKGDDVLDFEVDRAADPNAVADAVVDDLDRRTLDAQHLPDQRYDARHRPAELTAEHRRQLLGLLVRRSRVDEHADAPVAVRHHLRRIGDRRHLQAGD